MKNRVLPHFSSPWVRRRLSFRPLGKRILLSPGKSKNREDYLQTMISRINRSVSFIPSEAMVPTFRIVYSRSFSMIPSLSQISMFRRESREAWKAAERAVEIFRAQPGLAPSQIIPANPPTMFLIVAATWG